MNKFEYKILKFKASKGWAGGNIKDEEISRELSSLGRQGWELVSSVCTTDAFYQSKLMIMTMKRCMV